MYVCMYVCMYVYIYIYIYICDKCSLPSQAERAANEADHAEEAAGAVQSEEPRRTRS